MGTRRVTWLVGTSVGVALLASSATPAAAADPVEVLFSSDGIVFSSIAPDGILDPLSILVPGESLASALWIRNPASTPAIVRVSVNGLSVSSAPFAEAVALTTSDSHGGDVRSRTLAELSECEVLVPSRGIDGGETMRLDLGFALSADALNASQSERASLSVLVAMRGAEAGPFAESACDDSGWVVGPQPAVPAGTDPTAGALAITGNGLPVPLVVIVGALLLGVGFFLLGARRRRESEES